MEQLLGYFCRGFKKLGKCLSPETVPEMVLRELAANDLWKIPVPKSLGGVGMDWDAWLKVMESFMRGYTGTQFYEQLICHACQLRTALYYANPLEKRSLIDELSVGRKISLYDLFKLPGAAEECFQFSRFLQKVLAAQYLRSISSNALSPSVKKSLHSVNKRCYEVRQYFREYDQSLFIYHSMPNVMVH